MAAGARWWVAAAAIAAAGFLLSTWVVNRPPWSNGVQVSDVPDYQVYGDAVAAGDVPYRDFGLEYPPLALVAFVVPSLVSGEGDTAAYERAFIWLMRLCGVGLVLVVALSLRRLDRSRPAAAAALAFVAVSPLLLGRIVLLRFDLLAALLLAAALAAFLATRRRLAFALLALGAAAKVYPALVLPLFLAAAWRRHGRRDALIGLGIFVVVLGAVIVPFLLVAPDGVWEAFRRQSTRPLQIESFGASTLLGLHQVAGIDLESVRSAGSRNLDGALPDAFSTASVLLLLAVLAFVWLGFWRGGMGRDRLVLAAAAAVTAFVAVGKVLSPQFLIWLVPLVPLVRGRRGLAASALLALALLLTQAYFPRRYLALADFAAAPSWLVLARDVVLVALLAVLAWPERGTYSRYRKTGPGSSLESR